MGTEVYEGVLPAAHEAQAALPASLHYSAAGMALYAAVFPGLPGGQTKLKNLIDGMPLPALTASEENANK